MRMRPDKWLFFAGFLAFFPVFSSDPPDSELNPVTGYTESVDLNPASRVRHTEDQGQAGRVVEVISSAAAANPRIAITAAGNSFATWWQDQSTDGVYFARRDVGTGTWAEEVLLSDPAEESREPEVIYHASQVWIAYEVPSGASIGIDVVGITDEAEPIPNVVAVATTQYTGNRDVRIHGELGHVWVTWVDTGNEVGWSEYEGASETWGTPDYEGYQFSTVQAARDAIRAIVLGE
jgi:hypothetical protein